MSNDNIKYFSATDIINHALAKKTDSIELGFTIINELTYRNIWDTFVRWVESQTELGYLLQVFPFAVIYYSKDKLHPGISMKLADIFLTENDLEWDEEKFNFESLEDPNLNGINAQPQKLNLLLISSMLNLPKIYLQNGLNNLFKAIGEKLNMNPNCAIDLGSLGILQSGNDGVYHIPVREKKESVFRNKVSIRGLMLKSVDKSLNMSNLNNLTDNNRYATLLNKSSLNNTRMEHSQDFEVSKIKSKIPKNLLYSINNQSNNNLSTNIANSMEINSTRNMNPNKITYNHTLNNNSDSDIFFQERLKTNIKPIQPSFIDGSSRIGNEYIQTLKTKSNLLHDTAHSNMNQSSQSQIKQMISKIVSVPLHSQDWLMSEMINAVFKKKEKAKLQTFPNLFNVYSNTLAAPCTSETTYIPLSHRIGSFYSLSLQNFIIDKTTKRIKKLYDEYFYKYKNIVINLPATEDEEYLSLLNLYKNSEKVNLRKDTYERYQKFILHHIQDDIIAHIKEEWLVNIVKMCMRAYNLNNAEAYNELLNESIKEIIFIYKVSMKKSILDYILKHPEQREKLNISTTFRKIKEYAQECIIRPSEENVEWKRNFGNSKIKLSANLMLTSQNVTKIKKYFVNTVQKTNYILIPNSWETNGLTGFIDMQKINLDEEKKIVNDDWRKFIEMSLKENTLYKDQMIIYFNSISGMMACQMRQLILNSIKSYYEFISLFRKENYYEPRKIFEDQFDPKFPFQRSFLDISIKPSSDKLSFCFSDELSDIHNKLIGIVHDVIKCSQDVERPDNSFIKNLERKNTLWEVPVIDIYISSMISSIDIIIKENLDYVNRVTDIYEPFVFVLNELVVLEKFKNANPKRGDIEKKIVFYEDKLKILRNDMPNSLYLNLIRVDCTEINNELRNNLYSYIVDLLKFVQNKNIVQKAKDLTDRIETLKENLDRVPNDEETLYQFETNLESYKNDKVPAIYTEYNDFLEWVFFYFDYDRYPIFPDSSKGESMGGLEIIIRNMNNIIRLISGWMDSFEGVLKDKRSIFETQLNKRRGEYHEELRKITSDIQHNKSVANSLLYDESFINALLNIEKEIGKASESLGALVKKEELLGAYPTDDEKLEQARKDLMPMIYFTQFANDLREQLEYETIEIKNIDFNKLLGFIEKSADIFEIHVGKLTNMKTQISKNRERYEALKFAAEFAKLVHNLIEILRFQHLGKEVEDLLEENKIYCIEFTKVVYDHEKGQDYLRGLKLIDFMRKKELIEKNRDHRLEIDKIVEEWENVKKMHECMARVSSEINFDFELCNFKDKKYTIIDHNNFKKIKELLNKNIKNLEDCASDKDLYQISNKIYMNLKTFKENLLELYEIIDKIEINQMNLEKQMSRANILQKNQDTFMKLKQAESIYKALIEQIEENPKILDLMKIKEVVYECNMNLHKALHEIPSE